LKRSVSVKNVWTGVVKGISSSYSTIKIVAADSSAAKNKDSATVRIKYDYDKSGPVIALVNPEKDSVSTSATSYTIMVKCTDLSGVLSVNGTSGTTTYAGVRDTGLIWKININALEANKVTPIVLTAIDSSLSANKTLDTVYIKSEIIKGYKIKFDKNDSAATGTMADQAINSGDSAKITTNAFVNNGLSFAGWITTPTGTDIVYVDGAMFKMGTSNVTLYAKWNKKTTFALTVTVTNGSVTKSPNLAVYDSGTVVTLTPVPADNYHFSGWSGALTGTANPATIIMNNAKSVTAGFEVNPPNTFALTVIAKDGTVKKSPDLSQYDSGTVVTLTATPAIGYLFTGWSGGVTGTTNPASITMDGAKNVTANFVLKTFALSITSTNGTVSKSPNSASYDSGTVVSLTATPAPGYQFTGWSGGLSGNTNPGSIIMDGAKSVTANFAIKTFTLTVAALNGSVTKDPNLLQYDSGVVVSLTAVAATGYSFTGWSGGVNGTTNPTFITMNGNKTVTAAFSQAYSVTYNANGGGLPWGHGSSGTIPIDPNKYAPGSTVTVLGNPGALTKTAYVFDGWSLTAGGAKVTSFTMGNSNTVMYACWVIKDTSGNTYTEVTIGNQIWLVENLKATKYNDGTNIPVMPAVPHEYLQVAGYYNNSGDVYYSGLSVSTGLLAPKGWHVPTQAEVNELSASVSNSAKALASKGTAPKTWYLGTGTEVGANPGTNNSSGFTAVPDGSYFSSIENCHGKAYFWISDLFSSARGMTTGSVYVISYDAAVPGQESFRADYGMSVRCVRDF
jgi:uncharacterized protein (TIGR02145 family)/uncharacterized repeat protein (TIGR02543 family)